MDINDKNHSEKQRVRQQVSEMNAEAVVAKMQDFERRLGEQDVRLQQQDAKISALQHQLQGYAVLEAAAGRIGTGPTSV